MGDICPYICPVSNSDFVERIKIGCELDQHYACRRSNNRAWNEKALRGQEAANDLLGVCGEWQEFHAGYADVW
jgi:hypothetical protein